MEKGRDAFMDRVTLVPDPMVEINRRRAVDRLATYHFGLIEKRWKELDRTQFRALDYRVFDENEEMLKDVWEVLKELLAKANYKITFLGEVRPSRNCNESGCFRDILVKKKTARDLLHERYEAAVKKHDDACNQFVTGVLAEIEKKAEEAIPTTTNHAIDFEVRAVGGSTMEEFKEILFKYLTPLLSAEGLFLKRKMQAEDIKKDDLGGLSIFLRIYGWGDRYTPSELRTDRIADRLHKKYIEAGEADKIECEKLAQAAFDEIILIAGEMIDENRQKNIPYLLRATGGTDRFMAILTVLIDKIRADDLTIDANAHLNYGDKTEVMKTVVISGWIETEKSAEEAPKPPKKAAA